MHQLGAGGVFLSAGTCWPFWVKTYQLGICAILGWWRMAILNENVSNGVVTFSGSTLWPF